MNLKLINNDCLTEFENIPQESVDMVLVDPPYGLTRCSWDIPLDFELMWGGVNHVTKQNAAILFFSFQPFTTDLIQSNRKDFRYEIIWEKTQKTGFYNANRMPLKGHENICVFYKKLPTYNPQKYQIESNSIGRVRKQKADRCVLYGNINEHEYIDTGERYPHDVIHFSNWNGGGFGNNKNATKHPTQKPIPLLEYLIKTYSNEGDTVLDFCMGVGSTGVACKNTNRNFIGIEMNKDFYDIAVERVNENND